MKISIISAVHNGAQTIAQTLRSVASQSHPDVEHIVIDGESTDGTVELIEEFREHLAVAISEPDHGIYDAMNKGIAHATGEVIGTLNSDDVYAADDVLAKVAQTFATQEVDSCYADLLYVDRNDMDRIVRYWKSCAFKPGLFERGWIPAHPTFFVRRSVYQRFGGFDLQYAYQSDFELAMRLLEVHRISSAYVPEIFVKMRMGGTTNKSIGNIFKGNLESYRACKFHGLKVSPVPFFTKKFLSRLPQFFTRPIPS